MRLNKLVYLLLTVLILALAFQTYQLVRFQKQYFSLAKPIAKETEINEKIQNNLSLISNLVIQKGKTFDQITKNSMEFVHNYSIHAINEERDSYIYGLSVKEFLAIGLEKLVNAHLGQGEKPSLSCGLRSHLMKAILDGFGIKSRLVQIFSDSNPDFPAHRLLEVLNPNNSNWELWDPDYNVSYMNEPTKQVVNGVDFVCGDPNQIVPQRGDVVGWEATNSSEVKNNFRGAIMFENENSNLPGSIIYLNLSLFDPKKINFNGMSFQDFSRRSFPFARFLIKR